MSDPEELQIHEDEGRNINKRHTRNNEAATKIEAVKRAQKYSIHSAAKKFNVDRRSVREWKHKENALKQQVNNTARGSKRKRLDGGGRQVTNPEIDVLLANWIREKRENKQPVSRRIISNKAGELFRGTDMKISIGWLNSFLKRHKFTRRRVTTTAQKAPENYAEAVAKFIVHVEERKKAVNFGTILAMDETAVTVVTTGHEKMRITVCLTARSDGKKLLPYVLVHRKRPVAKIVEQFKGKLIINWNESVWMNDDTTADFLKQVVKSSGVFSGKTLLVWDAFAAHKSVKTLAVLNELNVEAAFIPGGCTKFIQAPDVSWNKPLKEKIRHYYTIWMNNDSHKEFTKGGNQKAPALEIVLDWIDRAWKDLSKEVIVKSFKACALTTATDGTEDDQITCFKPNGSIGTRGLDVLREIRAQSAARDGRNDFEEADILEEGNLEEGELGEEIVEEINLEDLNYDEFFYLLNRFDQDDIELLFGHSTQQNQQLESFNQSSLKGMEWLKNFNEKITSKITELLGAGQLLLNECKEIEQYVKDN